MSIDNFFLKSVGEWSSMRSGHSLAFQVFEEVRTNIQIKLIDKDDPRVEKFIKKNLITLEEFNNPYIISWEAKSDWNRQSDYNESSTGESLLIPIPASDIDGKIIRSLGYSEPVPIISTYKILEDETLIIHSEYSHIRTEERIWFISENLRSRSSVTRAKSSQAILQTSYASELRCIKTNL